MIIDITLRDQSLCTILERIICKLKLLSTTLPAIIQLYMLPAPNEDFNFTRLEAPSPGCSSSRNRLIISTVSFFVLLSTFTFAGLD